MRVIDGNWHTYLAQNKMFLGSNPRWRTRLIMEKKIPLTLYYIAAHYSDMLWRELSLEDLKIVKELSDRKLLHLYSNPRGYVGWIDVFDFIE